MALGRAAVSRPLPDPLCSSDFHREEEEEEEMEEMEEMEVEFWLGQFRLCR